MNHRPVYQEHAPSAALRPYVACYWTHQGSPGQPQRILPDGCLDLIVDLRRARIEVVGTMTTAVVERSDAFDALGVRFRPGEAAGVLGVGARELTDRVVPLGDVWGADPLAEQVCEGRTLAARLRILDRALLARVGARWADWRIRRAVARFEAGAVPIREVAAELGLGERQLERLFADRVGIGPKRFARVMRLQRILAPLDAPGADLTTITLLGGFSDPSHLVREVRDLCGVTPGRLAAERSAMSDPSNRPPPPADTGLPTTGGERWSTS